MDWLEAHIPPWAIIAIVAHGVVLLTVAYLILLERKVASWAQDRLGPNRVGFDFGLKFLPKFRFWGLGQPLADGLKFIFKEDYRPRGVDRILFTLAPGLMMAIMVVSIAVLPLGGARGEQTTIDGLPVFFSDPAAFNRNPSAAAADYIQKNLIPPGEKLIGQPRLQVSPFTITYAHGWYFQIANLNIGILFILAVLSLSVYGVVIGGWASNSKFSFLGGLRATASMISYEIPLGLAVLCIVVTFGTLDLATLVERQAHDWPIAGLHIVPAWNVFSQPLAFLLFLVCIHAEANRAPFDLAECEQELVGGYHTEYSSMRFALFFLAEYAGMITTSAVCVALFFGGWDFPGLRGPAGAPILASGLGVCLLRALVFFVKTLLVVFIFMWVRWSLPRFRFDQLLMLAWRALIPISLALLMATAVIVWLFRGQSAQSTGVGGQMAVALLGTNIIVLAVSLLISTVIPPAPATNRRLRILGSRFAPAPANN